MFFVCEILRVGVMRITLVYIRINRRSVKVYIAGAPSNSVGVEQEPESTISNKLPGDVQSTAGSDFVY